MGTVYRLVSFIGCRTGYILLSEDVREVGDRRALVRANSKLDGKECLY